MRTVRYFCSNILHNKQYFVTTPIYYVNAAPHLGHLYSSVVADFVKRWRKLCGCEKIIFSTGTDEHGTKIQQSAAKSNVNLSDYCKNVSGKYSEMSKMFNIGYTDFISTTEERHLKAVHEFWNSIERNGFIYSSKYQGWYCVSDETFLSNSQLKEETLPSGEKRIVSLESGHPCDWTEEQNYMFRLSKFQDDLKYWLKNENCVKPKKFHGILSDMVESDVMSDFSISRPSSRVHWGIPVPNDSEQTVYVWMDALVNYLTVAGYPDVNSERFKTSWPPDVQVIGKDILKFHGIYWPSFLIAAGLEPPRALFCHSHWTVDGHKMSKSKNNVICPFEKSRQYTTDGLRYFLLREGVAHSDGNYSEVKAVRILNSELADTLGNLLSRCCGKVLNPGQVFPEMNPEAFRAILNEDSTKKLIHALAALPDLIKAHYDEFNVYKSIDCIIGVLHSANVFFETMKPWELKKTELTKDKLNAVLHLTMEALRICGIALQPVVPEISRALLDKLTIGRDEREWRNIHPFSWEDGKRGCKKISNENAVLFARIVERKEEKTKESKGKKKKSSG